MLSSRGTATYSWLTSTLATTYLHFLLQAIYIRLHGMLIHIAPCTQSIHFVNLATQRVVLQSANIHTCEGYISML